MPVSDMKRRGVDFDHASGAGESPAEAPARSSTCGAFLVMPELFWWGRLEWSPRQKRQLLTVFTYFLASKAVEIFIYIFGLASAEKYRFLGFFHNLF